MAYKCVTSPTDYPINDGAFRSLKVVSPRGTVVSAVRPAPMRLWMTYPMTVVDSKTLTSGIRCNSAVDAKSLCGLRGNAPAVLTTRYILRAVSVEDRNRRDAVCQPRLPHHPQAP